MTHIDFFLYTALPPLSLPPSSLILLGEWGGPTKGGTVKEPTRFGDWERKGRCTDFE